VIPIPIFFARRYTTTVRGTILKIVPCENCSTEYVYVMEREATGAGTSAYMLNNQGAADQSKLAAADTLSAVLANDFDPVPCPACGHYQRYMFPKLSDKKETWVQTATLALLAAGCLDVVIALYWSAEYLQGPNDQNLTNMITAWLVLPVFCLVWMGLSLLKRVRARRFDPNSEDQQSRIAIGKSRAITRAEFEKEQQAQGQSASGSP
jgi:hypothetical protein